MLVFIFSNLGTVLAYVGIAIVAIVLAIAIIDDMSMGKRGKLDDYLGTGEVCKFHYKGANDLVHQKREVMVNHKYQRGNYTYYDCYDIEIDDYRTFREDRIKFL